MASASKKTSTESIDHSPNSSTIPKRGVPRQEQRGRTGAPVPWHTLVIPVRDTEQSSQRQAFVDLNRLGVDLAGINEWFGDRVDDLGADDSECELRQNSEGSCPVIPRLPR